MQEVQRFWKEEQDKILKWKLRNIEPKPQIPFHQITEDSKGYGWFLLAMPYHIWWTSFFVQSLIFNWKSLLTCSPNNLFWEYVPNCLSKISILLNFSLNIHFKFNKLTFKNLTWMLPPTNYALNRDLLIYKLFFTSNLILHQFKRRI
jgi:hypothetical protein